MTPNTIMDSSAPSTIQDDDELQQLIFDSLESMSGSNNSHMKDTSSPFKSSRPAKTRVSRTASTDDAGKKGGGLSVRRTVTNPEGAASRKAGHLRSSRNKMSKSTGSAGAPAPHDIIRMLEAKANSGDNAEAGDFLQFLKGTSIDESEEFQVALAVEEGKRAQTKVTAPAGRTSRRSRKPRSVSPKPPKKDQNSGSPTKDPAAPPVKRSLSPLPRLLGGLGFRRQVTNPEAYSKVHSSKVRRQATNPEGATAATAPSRKSMVKKTKSQSSSKDKQSPQQVIEMLEMCANSGNNRLAGAYMQKLKEMEDPSDRRRRSRRSMSPKRVTAGAD